MWGVQPSGWSIEKARDGVVWAEAQTGVQATNGFVLGRATLYLVRASPARNRLGKRKAPGSRKRDAMRGMRENKTPGQDSRTNQMHARLVSRFGFRRLELKARRSLRPEGASRKRSEASSQPTLRGGDPGGRGAGPREGEGRAARGRGPGLLVLQEDVVEGHARAGLRDLRPAAAARAS